MYCVYILNFEFCLLQCIYKLDGVLLLRVLEWITVCVEGGLSCPNVAAHVTDWVNSSYLSFIFKYLSFSPAAKAAHQSYSSI